MGFFEGNEADSLARRPLEVRRRAFVESAVRAFGVRPPNPSNTWNGTGVPSNTQGAATGRTSRPGSGPPTALSWRPPDGCLYWAGAEYSTKFNGYMEGAVRSGEEVAATIAVALI